MLFDVYVKASDIFVDIIFDMVMVVRLLPIWHLWQFWQVWISWSLNFMQPGYLPTRWQNFWSLPRTWFTCWILALLVQMVYVSWLPLHCFFERLYYRYLTLLEAISFCKSGYSTKILNRVLLYSCLKILLLSSAAISLSSMSMIFFIRTIFLRVE